MGARNNAYFKEPNIVTVYPAGDYEFSYGLIINGIFNAIFALIINGYYDHLYSGFGITTTKFGERLMLVGQGILLLSERANITLRNIGSDIVSISSNGPASNSAYLNLKRIGIYSFSNYLKSSIC
ncbi:hypothetical protein [Bacillus cereus]|uniref:Uncharacterized protein n=1 Tax=Bacillus cereus TaxID=1396 RepID=A0A2B9DK25_BACCE|nr:hypothetical protein [Bacillus cereus]PGM87389.1 hypothetical protein CN958_30305 [Bacillus cereus]